MVIRIQEAASLRLDEIYRYTRHRWGAEQSDRYITELFAAFDQIESHGVALRANKSETFEWLKFTLEGAGARTHGYAFTDISFAGYRI